MTHTAEWLPRAGSGQGKGDLLRRSFEAALAGRPAEPEGPPQLAAVEDIERLFRRDPQELDTLRTLLSLGTRDALVAYSSLSPEAQRAASGVLRLPEELGDLLVRLLHLPDEAQAVLRTVLG